MVTGVVMNEAVSLANHGYMPVFIHGGGCPLLSMPHICMSSSTHLNWLGDWLVDNHGLSSPGDYLQDLSSNKQLQVASLLAWLGLTLKALKESK